MPAFLTPNETNYNKYIQSTLDSTFVYIMPLELVHLISQFAKIRHTEYIPIPHHDDDSVAAFVHECIYSSDDLPWIVHISTLINVGRGNFVLKDYVFLFKPSIATWSRTEDGKLAYCIISHLNPKRTKNDDVIFGRLLIGRMMECPTARIEFPFPIHAFARLSSDGTLLFFSLRPFDELV